MDYKTFFSKLKYSIQKYAKEKMGYTRAPSFYKENYRNTKDKEAYTIKGCDSYITLLIDKHFSSTINDNDIEEIITKLTYLVTNMINDKYLNNLLIEINNPYFVPLHNYYTNRSLVHIELNDNLHKLDYDKEYAKKYILGIVSIVRAYNTSFSLGYALSEYMYKDIDYLHNIVYARSNRILFNKNNHIIDKKIKLSDIIEITEYDFPGDLFDISVIDNLICVNILTSSKSSLMKIRCDEYDIDIDKLKELIGIQIKYNEKHMPKTPFYSTKKDVFTIRNDEDINKLLLEIL